MLNKKIPVGTIVTFPGDHYFYTSLYEIESGDVGVIIKSYEDGSATVLMQKSKEIIFISTPSHVRIAE